MGLTICCTNSTTEEYPQHDRSPYSGMTFAELPKASTLTPITPSRFVKENSQSLEKDYIINERLGKGGFGIVYKATHKRTKDIRAIKFISRAKLNRHTGRQLQHEIDILKHMDHPNIVKIFEFSENKKGYFIVNEYISEGELFNEISKRKNFSEVDAAYIMKQLIGAISYCHTKHVIHRDLKPENVLIDSIEDGQIHVKIIDFGYALLSPPEKIVNEKVGTIYYVAPEVLMGNYTAKCDMWSLGVIMYVLLSGKAPFNGQSDKEILSAIIKGKYKFSGKLWATRSPRGSRGP